MACLNAASFQELTAPPLRVTTQCYTIVQHRDVYSSFQVPMKTWRAAHVQTVCTRCSIRFFERLGT